MSVQDKKTTARKILDILDKIIIISDHIQQIDRQLNDEFIEIPDLEITPYRTTIRIEEKTQVIIPIYSHNNRIDLIHKHATIGIHIYQRELEVYVKEITSAIGEEIHSFTLFFGEKIPVLELIAFILVVKHNYDTLMRMLTQYEKTVYNNREAIRELIDNAKKILSIIQMMMR